MMSTAIPTGVRQVMQAIVSAVQIPLNYSIQWWNAETWQHADADSPYPPFRVAIHHPGVIRHLILKRDPLALADAYLNGFLDVDGDIEALIRLFRQMPPVRLSRLQTLRLWWTALSLPPLPCPGTATAKSRQIKGDPDQDREAIQHHYDVGNDFYQLWLDPHLVYTCAHYEHPDMSLKEAQEAKLDLICRKLRLRPGETLLDVGCGWGALLRWAVKHYGVRGYGITLSQAQVDFNRKLIQEEGLADRLQVDLCHYRDLPSQTQYDKIVAIGIIEHVGAANYACFLNTLRSLLKPGGLFLNHGITATRETHGQTLGERFMNRYFFPNGDLHSISTLLTAMEAANWEVVDVDAWRIHYAMTLRHWAANFDQAIEQIKSLIGERQVLLWRLYLIGCALAFEGNDTGLYQVLLRRQEDPWNLPLTRTDWLT